MEIVGYIFLIIFFIAFSAWVLYLDWSRHKIWVAKEKEQIELYRDIRNKL